MDINAQVAAHAARRGTDTALWSHDGRVVDYAELDRMAARAADRIAELPGDPSVPVAVRIPKSPEAIAVILGCLRASRTALVPSVELGQRSFDALVGKAGCGFVATITPGGVAWRQIGPPGPPPGAVPDGTALLLTTSGSTGVPKIVPVGAAAMSRFADWAADTFEIGAGTRVFNYAPLNFDLCLLDVWTTLGAGGTVAMVNAEHAVNPRYLTELVRDAEPEVVQAVPMMFQILANAAGPGAAPFETVRHVMLTGDHAAAPVRAALPGLFPKATFHNIYGCTETNDSFRFGCDAARIGVGDALPLGRPLPGVSALVTVDGEVLDGPGTGELLVSTPFQTDGYLHEPDRNRARFTDIDGVRYFRTGDLVSRAADGRLDLLGRNDFQVKVRGTRVNVAEIERVIGEHPEVAETVVVSIPDQSSGARLYAVTRRRDGTGLTGLGLRSHCAARLVKAAIPAEIHIQDRPLPRTSTGKVDRRGITEGFKKGS